MTLYYAKSSGGFYDSAIHGERTLTVTDPNWVRPTRTVTLQAGESYWEAGQCYASNTTGEAAQFSVPDLSAVPATVEEANPACTIPADAVAITVEAHQTLMAAQSQGKLIQADSSGLPVAVDPPAPTTAQLAAQVRAKRDTLISATDYLVMPDYPISADDLAQLKTYRAALRNVPEQSGFPASVTWPTYPVLTAGSATSPAN